jgi:hypothetical protein
MLRPLTWLAVAFAIPSIIPNLFSFFKAMQSETTFAPPRPHASVPELVSGIDRLESGILAASIVRRMYLSRLYQQFEARLRQDRHKLPQKSTVGKGFATAVLDDMAHELPPATFMGDESESSRKRLQNMLNVAKPWYRLSLAFTESSFALMLRGLSNSM